MKRIARFEKVSYEEFKKGYTKQNGNCNEDLIKEIYDKILLPKRATIGSAGYDFFMIEDKNLSNNQTITIPTGIRAYMEPGFVLKIYPRSSLGFKARVQLDNTVGIIDSDYYYSSNEGHIFIKITCDAKEEKTILLKQGTGFAQGIFLEFGITYDDCVEEVRNGGMGSTTK